MCIKAFEIDPWYLYDIPDQYKAQKMCDDLVRMVPQLLKYVLDWFVREHQIEPWDDDEVKFFEWHEGYKKRKAQKAKIKEELLPIAWHPSRRWHWCIPQDEKQEAENCGK